MYSLRASLKGTNAKSARALKKALGSEHSSVRKLIQTHLIHNTYVKQAKPRLGFPIGPVTFSDKQEAVRQYRGGEIRVRSGEVKAFPRLAVSIQYLGFACQSESDEASDSDEPYFVVAVLGLNGMVKELSYQHDNIDAGQPVGIGEFLIPDHFDIPPNPMVIRVIAFEHDEGDRDETVANVKEKLQEIASSVASVIGPADVADGPGLGAVKGGSFAAGPIAGGLANLIVEVFGLADDFIGQGIVNLFTRPEDVHTPPKQATFQGQAYNASIDINHPDEGHYSFFFDVKVVEKQPSITF